MIRNQLPKSRLADSLSSLYAGIDIWVCLFDEKDCNHQSLHMFWQSPRRVLVATCATLLHKISHKYQASDWLEKLDGNQNMVKGATVAKAGNYVIQAVFISLVALLPLQPMQAYKSFFPTCIFIQTGP